MRRPNSGFPCSAEVVFWSAKDNMLYVVQIAATKKENVAAKEAEDFVNSFKLAAG